MMKLIVLFSTRKKAEKFQDKIANILPLISRLTGDTELKSDIVGFRVDRMAPGGVR